MPGKKAGTKAKAAPKKPAAKKQEEEEDDTVAKEETTAASTKKPAAKSGAKKPAAKKPAAKKPAAKKPAAKRKKDDEEESDDEEAASPKKSAKASAPGKPKPNAFTAELAGVTDFKVPTTAESELKIVTWNVAGMNSIMGKGFEDYLKNESPDVLCLNETKINAAPKAFPGYHSHFLACSHNPGYSGVAILSKAKPISIKNGMGIDKHDKDGRMITAEFDNFYLVATYVPNSGQGLKNIDYRMTWEDDFIKHIQTLEKTKPVIWCGDINVCHKPEDLANPKSNYNKTPGYTQKEIDKYQRILDNGFVDVFRTQNPAATGVYTFWSYRGGARQKDIGWRLDSFVCSKSIFPRCKEIFIRKWVNGSDHCPMGLILNKS